MKPKVGLKTSTNLTNICINRPKKRKKILKLLKKITINFTEMKGILREYYEQEYVTHQKNEMDKFLGRHKPRKQTQEEIEYLNRATTKRFNP